MNFAIRSRLVASTLVLSAAFAGPAHSQKILSEGIKDLATQIATNVSKEKKQKVAILPFRELDGKPTILGTYISEELVTDLFMIGGLDIVERTMLDRLIGELKLGQTGVIDPDTAKRVGKVAGVDAIVTGSITDLQSYVALNCRLIDAQTGRIFAAAQTKIAKDDDVRKIMGAALPSSEGEGSRTPAPRSEPAPQPKPALQQQVGNLTFELKSCNLLGTALECVFLISSRGQDSSLDFWAPNSRIIDEEGNEYHATSMYIGRSSAEKRFDNSNATATLASGVPVKAQLNFEGIPSEAQRVALVEFRARQRGVAVQFRNVPLVRP